ncbi:MAG: protease pro-enzyme activation domain-containing protein [Acidimicrobiales bacterium]
MTRRGPGRRWHAVAVGAALVALGVPGVEAAAVSPRVEVGRAALVPVGDRVVTTPVTATFDLFLTPRDPAALTAFLHGITNPASPDYRRYLTPSQFARAFGPSPAAIAAVRRYLTGFGLRIDTLSAGHVAMRVEGSEGDVARAFAAPVATIRTAHGLFAQFTAAASLPTTLAHLVTGVAGLSGPVPRAPLVRRAHVATAGACPAAGSGTGTVPAPTGGFTVGQQARLYGLSAYWARGDTGVGQTIGIYELAPYLTSDVQTFFSCYAISPSVSNVLVDGGSADPVNLEPTLDVEEAAALAPGAAVTVYVGPNLGTGPMDVWLRIADDNAASVVTTSWGGCEGDPSTDAPSEQLIFEQMAAQGQTVLAAAGDQGSSDCNYAGINDPAVDDPASQPYVTGVGGLTVTNISPLNQTVWNDHDPTCPGAGGGGESATWPRPAWQNAPGITAGFTQRLVPDLSVMGDPSTGFVAYFTGTYVGKCAPPSLPAWVPIGGTSIGSPLVGAMVAVAAQACGVARLGFINPTLYSLARAGTGFDDVTTGSNDIFGVGVYSAGPGYDMASGLGSPDPATFLPGLCPVALDASHSSLSASSTSSSVVSPITITLLARDSHDNPLLGVLAHFTASAPSGAVELNRLSSSVTGPGAAAFATTTDGQGSIQVTLTSSEPGPVAVGASVGSTSLTTNVTFSALTTDPPGRAGVARVVARVAGFTLVARAPASSGSGEITAYQYSLDRGSAWVRFSAVTRSVTVLRLARGAAYRVVVRALNAYGAGPASAPVTVRTR